MYEDALEKFLECQEPVRVTRKYHQPGFDIWDSPSELYESVMVEADDGTEIEVTDETDGSDDTDATDDTDIEVSDDSGDSTDGDEGADETAEDDTVDIDSDFAGIDDMTGEDVEIEGDDVNSGEDEPTSVSAKQLLSELIDNGIYNRVAEAAKESVGGNEITVKDLLPIIALAIKKFMKNKNYASLSKVAMKGLVMNIAKTMAHPPKKEETEEESPAETEPVADTAESEGESETVEA